MHSCCQETKAGGVLGWFITEFSAVIYAVTMVSKTKENNQDILPDGDVDDKDFDPDLHEFKSHILAAKAPVTHSRLVSPYHEQKSLD